MRLFAPSAALLSTTMVLAVAGTVAVPASAATPHTGGVAYGASLPIPDVHPIASRLSALPRDLRVGDPLPQVAVRVRQVGTATVRARLVLLRLPSNRFVARVDLGRVRTGSVVTAALPAGTTLAKGRYLLRLHAVDPHGRVLTRDARHPGRTIVVVHRAPPVIAPAAAPEVELMPPPAPSPGGPGVFPVAGPFTFGGPAGRFGAGRPGHIHQGQDMPAAEGTPVVAPYTGAVSQTSYQASGAGEYVVLDADDGRDYLFAHCVRGSTVVRVTQRVAPGQQLCQVGATGDADGPHLHFEIWPGGWRLPGSEPIDPLPELRAWSGR